MGKMPRGEIACPHCTFLNATRRQKCSMCLKFLRKRGRPEDQLNEANGHDTPPIQLQKQRFSSSNHDRGSSDSNGSDTERSACKSRTPQLPEKLPSATTHADGPQSSGDVIGSRHGNASVAETLFSTAAGKPVRVSAAAMQKAAQLCGDGGGAPQHHSVAKGPERVVPTASSCVVSSLFETASGRPIHISAEAMEVARTKFTEQNQVGASAIPQADQEAPARPANAVGALGSHLQGAERQSKGVGITGPSSMGTVTTLFSTAAGRPVQVSEEALKKAEAAMQVSEAANIVADRDQESAKQDHNDTPRRAPERQHVLSGGKVGKASVDTLPQARPVENLRGRQMAHAGPRPFQPPKQRTDAHQRPDLIRVGTAPSGATAPPLRGQGGFVPPQQLRNTPRSINYGETPTAASSINRPHAGAGKPQPPAGKLQLLSFSFRKFHSTPSVTGGATTVASVPSLPDLAAGRFSFRLSDCGAALAEALANAPERHSGSTTAAAAVSLEAWQRLLLGLGASATHCSLFWCRQAVVSSLFQLSLPPTTLPAQSPCEDVRSGDSPQCPLPFTPTSLALLLALRYNREIVEGDRPALRKLVEGDIPPASLMVLYVSEVCEERAAPHRRIIKLCDGFYHMRASLDIQLSSLVREGVLVVGRRLAVCGARLLLHGQCEPEECAQQTVVSLNYNCVRPVEGSTPLGLGMSEPAPLPICLVHPQGGLVPALEGVVSRVLPPFYLNASIIGDGQQRGSVDRSSRIVRNRTAQMTYYASLAKELSTKADDGSVNDGSRSNSVAQGKVGQRVSRVQSVVLRSVIPEEGGKYAEALIQHWETCDDEEACVRGAISSSDDADTIHVPKEGTRVIVYALTPAESQNAAMPFSHAKLFYSARTLHFNVVKASEKASSTHSATDTIPESSVSVGRHTYLSFSGVVELSIGAPVDVLGLYIGSAKTEQGYLALLLLSDGAYALLQVPLPSPSREINLTLPPSSDRPTLLLVQNGTFVSHEDTQAGSDCARIFANEYTTVVVSPRSVPGNTSLSVVSLLEEAERSFQSARSKHLSRKDEIIRCCVEEPPPSFPPSLNSTGVYMRTPGVAGTANSFSTGGHRGGPGGGGGSYTSNHTTAPAPSSAATSSREKRVPYYLREQKTGVGDGSSAQWKRGVVLPSPHTVPPATSHAHTMPRHSYGNITSLRILGEGGSFPHEGLPLFSEGSKTFDGFYYPPTIRGGVRTNAAITRVVVTWRFGHANDVACAAVTSGAVLESILHPCIPAHKLGDCFAHGVNAGQQHEDSSEAPPSSPAVEQHPWWKLLCSSVAVPTRASLGATTALVTDGEVLWTHDEWTAVLRLLQGKLTHALYKFTTCSEPDAVVERAFFIVDNCPVSPMFA